VNDLTPAELLASLPQAEPCRFVDAIVESNARAVVSRYAWTDADCDGHFPGNPIVPGVKLLGMAAQTAFAATGRELSGIERMLFKMSVRPGDVVVCRAVPAGAGAADVELKFLGGPKDGEVILAGRITGEKP